MSGAVNTPSLRVRAGEQSVLPSLDLWVATLAGDRVWVEEGDRPDVRARITAGLVLLGLFGTATRLLLVVPDRLDLVESTAAVWLAVGVGTGAAVLLAIRPLAIVAGHRSSPSSLLWRATWRGLVFLALLVATVILMPDLRVLGAWPLGFVAGADMMLSVRAIGIEPRPWAWWRRFLVSPIHLGVLGGVIATVVVRRGEGSTIEIVAIYLAMHALTAAACGVIWVLARLDQLLADELDTERAAIVERERRYRAHWLHDDVLSEIRLTSLRLQSRPDGVDAVRELGELDHRLRLRQVDELFAGGGARLADILQPHVRRAQSLGVDVIEVPSYEEVGRVVDEATGRLFARAVSVLTSNAINAGADTLAIAVHAVGPVIELRVTDDAGGFLTEDIPAGRGLDQLAADIGRDNLWITPVNGGSTVSVRLRERS